MGFIPRLLIAKAIIHTHIREVYSDHYAAFEDAVSYLHSIGHNKIAYAGIKTDGKFTNHRRLGFVDKITQLGIEENRFEVRERKRYSAFEAGNEIAGKYYRRMALT